MGNERCLQAALRLAENGGLELAVDTTFNTCHCYCTSVVAVVSWKQAMVLAMFAEPECFLFSTHT